MCFVVNRVEARSDQFDMYMQLDVNTDVYPMHVGDKFMMVLATTLNLDGTPDSGFFSPVMSTLLSYDSPFYMTVDSSTMNLKINLC